MTFREKTTGPSSSDNNPNYLVLRGGNLESSIILITLSDCLSSWKQFVRCQCLSLIKLLESISCDAGNASDLILEEKAGNSKSRFVPLLH